jgi:outer membrane autotransporter protein
VDDYATKIDGTTAFNNSVDSALLGQIPFGVTVKGEFETNGWAVKPMADVTFVSQFGDTESSTTATFQRGSVTDQHIAEFTGKFATTMSVGVEAQKGNCSFGIEYNLTKGDNDRTNSSVMGKVRYQF